ncbi:MAG: branched-chain amino acid ABC transporter permease [Candidatus Heimdallarchaeota archaeon]|nr:branched-chain amino acid ABC transporter permease [Candidatus Heimdallarchaeota archaeon]
MEVKKDVVESNSKSSIDKYFPKRLIINAVITTIILSLFISFTVWGIIHDNRYFKFNTTSLVVTSLFLASIYLCISLGLNLTYDLMGFANFAHAEYFIIGAYTGVIFNFYYPLGTITFNDLFLVMIIAFVVAGFIAVLGDILVFGPLRRMGTSNESLMISSIGWGIILRNLVSLYFGGGSYWFDIPDIDGMTLPKFSFSTRPIRMEWTEEPFPLASKLIGSKSGTGYFKIKDVEFYVPYEMIIAILVTLILVIGLIFFLDKTKTGTALRATSNNLDLAESSGIDTEKMIKLTWFIGGGLAGVAGLIFVLRFPVIPAQGFLFLLPAFAVVVLGGVGSIKGSFFASLIIAFTQTISKSYLIGIESYLEDQDQFRGLISSYDIVIPFVILIVVILIRPRGLFGEEE